MSTPSHQRPWGRRRLLLLLAVGAIAVVATMLGLLLALRSSLQTSTEPVSRTAAVASTAPGGAAWPGPRSTRVFPVIRVPSPTRTGPAGIPSGFPRTREGALAQLAALDQQVLQAASVSVAQETIEAWAVPGGPTPEGWSGVRAVAAMVSPAQTDGTAGSGGTGQLAVTAVPAMGLIRDGESAGEVTACVDFVLTATLTSTATVAAADCQRMVWVEDRWMIAAGPEPEQAPSVWPGTDAAYDAGYAEWRDE